MDYQFISKPSKTFDIVSHPKLFCQLHKLNLGRGHNLFFRIGGQDVFYSASRGRKFLGTFGGGRTFSSEKWVGAETFLTIKKVASVSVTK